MDVVIKKIKNPLDKYTSIQKKVSDEIRKIGGIGTIHGCIVDIDWYNHIYVNPYDLKIVGYWASDMINKVVYPDIPSLLQEQRPELYTNYLNQITDNSKKLPAISSKAKGGSKSLTLPYLETDIYKASREISKMQKLGSNILTTWVEDTSRLKMIDGT